MDATTAEKLRVALQTDGRIDQALAMVDGKLAQWSEALCRTQQVLASIAKRLDEREALLQKCHQSLGTGTKPATTEVVDAPATDARSEVVTAGAKSARPSTKAAKTKALEMTADGPAIAPGIMSGSAAPTSTGAPSPSEEEDEAFLATLEEDVAKRIRVMRRISGTPVRELWERYQREQAKKPQSKQTTRRSWWKRR